jgi:hypothetical protein
MLSLCGSAQMGLAIEEREELGDCLNGATTWHCKPLLVARYAGQYCFVKQWLRHARCVRCHY